MLTDAAPESDHIDPAELAHIRRHVVPGTPTEYLDRKLGTRISAALEREQLAHVGAAAGEAEQTTVGIELAAHFRRRQAAALHDIEKRAGVHVPRARAHDQTLEGRESHAGRHRALIEGGSYRTAASKLQADDPAGGPAGRHARTRRVVQVPVRGAMKPVASHTKHLLPALRHRIAAGRFRELGVVGGVEHAHHGERAEPRPHGRDDRQGGRIVQGSEHVELREGGELRVSEPRGRPEALTAMHDAVHGRIEPAEQVATVHGDLRQPREHEVSGLGECANRR